MSKLPIQSKVFSPVEVGIPASVQLVQPVVLTLTKVRECDGKAVETTILTNAIEGVEPSTVMFKGKAFKGIKVYTKTGWFKALTTQEGFANGAAFALQSGQAVKITAKAPLMLGKGK